MPIAPRNPYFKWTCNGCGWSIVTKERSDAIKRPVAHCQKCQGTSFTPSSGSALDVVAAELNRLIHR